LSASSVRGRDSALARSTARASKHRAPRRSIYLDGSEEQKQKWLPQMARFEKIGCFGLAEPLVSSGTSGGLTTTAKREGDTWILNGQKRWIGNAPWCDLSIIWARDLGDNQVKDSSLRTSRRPVSASSGPSLHPMAFLSKWRGGQMESLRQSDAAYTRLIILMANPSAENLIDTSRSSCSNVRQV
jgi:hypothetical protein